MVTVKARKVSQYRFRRMTDDGLAEYEEEWSPGNYLWERPAAAATDNSRAARLKRGKAWLARCNESHPEMCYALCPACLCPTSPREHHDIFRRLCFSCGVVRTEKLVASVVRRWGLQCAVIKLKALAAACTADRVSV